jgi:hypothetical protein
VRLKQQHLAGSKALEFHAVGNCTAFSVAGAKLPWPLVLAVRDKTPLNLGLTVCVNVCGGKWSENRTRRLLSFRQDQPIQGAAMSANLVWLGCPVFFFPFARQLALEACKLLGYQI